MNQEQIKTLIEMHSAEKILHTLEPYVTNQRKQKIQTVTNNRLNKIQLAIESPSNINNALACVRTSEALGTSTVHIITPEGSANAIRSVTQGAFYWIDLFFYKSLKEFLNHMKKENIQLAGAIMSGETALNSLPIENSICLILGNEQKGLSQTVQSACTYLYHIPMYGMSESLNLSVSAAISLYDTTSRKRKLLNATSDLNAAEKALTKAKYFLQSVDERTARSLLFT